ncbi:hypothetical protein [Roseivirga misakiensis]|uniref:Uncharacterized protein n=1 Tax=Roseivirga misakiensis TaxID=1563681 RepID=A0A1E5T0F8_9BACT|nr:hypothetical protein [Roseivirga misakiensis]OEK04872.1 hypothetical protein BFP71_15650 [Roseivirga misakiensis]
MDTLLANITYAGGAVYIFYILTAIWIIAKKNLKLLSIIFPILALLEGLFIDWRWGRIQDYGENAQIVLGALPSFIISIGLPFIGFYIHHFITQNLPKDPMIDSLIEKSKSGAFGNDDYPSIYSLLESKIFEKSSYQKAIQNVENQKELINKMIAVLTDKKDDWDWKFNMFNEYKVVFTLYGTGGSYDPDNGTITLLTNKSGGFMNYKNPANTIIHEITHMGMEYSLVRKYNLPHGLKERLVDTLVYLMFKEDLPDYRIQQMGDPKINDDLKSANDLESLNSIVSKFVNK